jgi:hypothetical protein
MPDMYECQVLIPFKKDGKTVLKWAVKPVSFLDSGAQRGIRCKHCFGEVRVHKQRVVDGPKDHVEHLKSQDAKYCRGGDTFCGEHRPSEWPVQPEFEIA